MLKITDEKFESIIAELDEVSGVDRVAFFSEGGADRFLLWWYYYFREDFEIPLAEFHYDWITDIFEGKNVFIEGFRGSIKTSIVTKVVAYYSVIKHIKFAVWQSFAEGSSTRNTTQIALSLKNERIESDYGIIFSVTGGRDDLAKKSVGDFDTTTGVKILASSLGQKLRGAVSRNQRPDLLILDDIDVSDSVRSKDVIDKNYEKLNEETIGSMSKKKYQIIFLGNTIKKDGIVPRFREEKKHKKRWSVFVQALIVDGIIMWDFFTEDMIDAIKEDSSPSAYNQNVMCIPSDLHEGGMVKKEHLRYYDQVNLDDFDELFMHVDTTHTGKTTSDYYCIVVAGLNKKDNNFYVLDYDLKKAGPSVQATRTIVMYQKFGLKIKKLTYDEKANQGFGYWIKKLAKDEYKLSLPIEELKYPKDKVTHFDPHTPHFVANRVYLPSKNPDMMEAESQLIAFPTKGIADDFVDGLSGAFDNFHNEGMGKISFSIL